MSHTHTCTQYAHVCSCESVWARVRPINILLLHILLGLSTGQYHLSAVQCLLVTQHWRQMKRSTISSAAPAFGLGLRSNAATDCVQSLSSICCPALSLNRADCLELISPLRAGDRKQTHANANTSWLDMQFKIHFFGRRNNLNGCVKPQWADKLQVLSKRKLDKWQRTLLEI